MWIPLFYVGPISNVVRPTYIFHHKRVSIEKSVRGSVFVNTRLKLISQKEIVYQMMKDQLSRKILSITADKIQNRPAVQDRRQYVLPEQSKIQKMEFSCDHTVPYMYTPHSIP